MQFSGSIPPKFEHILRDHRKQRYGKIATTIVLDKDENLLWSGLQWHGSFHSNAITCFACSSISRHLEMVITIIIITIIITKQCISMVWFPKSWFYLSRKKCILAIFSYFKKSEKEFKILLRKVYLLARCLMLNWSWRHAFIYATKTLNLWLSFFFTVFGRYKKYSTGNKE